MLRKPFLKWAGGKYRLLGKILQELPAGKRFVEAFAGSCALYLNVACASALVADSNRDLIELYRHVQEEGAAFVALCQSLFTAENNCRESYLELRAEFNRSTDSRWRAALLLYLNRHGFNGLVRYNARGDFNVPFGKYVRPYFPRKELEDFHQRTRELETSFVACDFRELFARLEPGDLVYCDPPYVPLSATAKFTSYAGKAFDMQDQRDLARLALDAQQRGISLVISNHNTPETRALYASAELLHFDVQRYISCKSAKRERVSELLAIYRQILRGSQATIGRHTASAAPTRQWQI